MEQESPREEGLPRKDASQPNLISLTSCVSNAPELIVLNSLLTLYHNNNRKGLSQLENQRLLSRLVRNIVSPTGLELALFIPNVGATTKPELVEHLKLNWQSVNRVVDTWVDAGLLRKYGKVGVPYSVRQGKRVPIYGFYDALPEQVIEAQKRYGSLRNRKTLPINTDPLIIEKIVQLFEAKQETNRIDVLTVLLKTSSVPSEMRQRYADLIVSELRQTGVKVWQ